MSKKRRRYQPPPAAPPVISISAGINPAEHLRRHLDALGCTCDVEITFHDEHGIQQARVAHDSWCPLLARLARGTN